MYIIPRAALSYGHLQSGSPQTSAWRSSGSVMYLLFCPYQYVDVTSELPSDCVTFNTLSEFYNADIYSTV